MKHPPYNLRVNKAVERFLLIEILQRLLPSVSCSYFGMGGPFLEDCKLISRFFPTFQVHSIEENAETLKRQEFHRYSRAIKLERSAVRQFVSKFTSSGNEVVWLDYTGLSLSQFDEFSELLTKSEPGTIVKITQRCVSPITESSSEEEDKVLRAFGDTYGEFLPREWEDMMTFGEFPVLVCEMVRFASGLVYPEEGDTIFQPIHTSYYNDGTMMCSVTGQIIAKPDRGALIERFADWVFHNTSWERPHKIDVPNLSIKERLFLEEYLPGEDGIENCLLQKLGYKIDSSESRTLTQLKQYALFHQYYPYFARLTM